MGEISPRQLRYWEQKGLIQSVPQEEKYAPRKISTAHGDQRLS